MLEPEGRQPLLDALKPPPGSVLDRAVGTSYSLDLLALLTAPLAFALFDHLKADGAPDGADPIAVIEAVRRHADQIDIFCQAGQVAPMREHRPIVAYLERSVHGVVPPKPTAIFHPKVWLLRYRSGHRGAELSIPVPQPESDASTAPGTPSCVLTARLTATRRAFDTEPISAFIRALPGLAVNPLDDARVASLNALADELADVRFTLPDGFRAARFWPMGHDGVDRWPLDGRIDRLLTISPFLTAPMLKRLSAHGRHHVLVSRPESFDMVGADALAAFSGVLALSPSAVAGSRIATGCASDRRSSGGIHGWGAPGTAREVLHGGCRRRCPRLDRLRECDRCGVWRQCGVSCGAHRAKALVRR